MDSAILYTKRPPDEATALDLLDAGGYILKQGAGLCTPCHRFIGLPHFKPCISLCQGSN